MHNLAERRGEHLCLDWHGEEPPMHDGRAAAAPLVFEAELGQRCFDTGFIDGKHINLLELESLILLRDSHVMAYRHGGSYLVFVSVRARF